MTNLLDSSVEVSLHAWTTSDDYWQTKADVFQAAKEALDVACIEIPFPHQVAVPYGDAEAAMPILAIREDRHDRPDDQASPSDAHQDSGDA